MDSIDMIGDNLGLNGAAVGKCQHRVEGAPESAHAIDWRSPKLTVRRHSLCYQRMGELHQYCPSPAKDNNALGIESPGDSVCLFGVLGCGVFVLHSNF